MYEHMNFSFFVDNTLLKMRLGVMRSTVAVVKSPGNLIKFPPTVSLVRCVSAFCGSILATILPYVTVILAVTVSLGTNKMVFVPDGILVTTTCASWPISFANEFSQIALVSPLIRCLYSSDSPVLGSMTKFA